MTKTFHIIDFPKGVRRIVGVIHETAAETAGAERAVATAAIMARLHPDHHFHVVEHVGRGEIAVVGPDGPVAA